MADIKKLALLNHLRSDANRYVIRYRKGRLVSSGAGASFWFSPMVTSMAEVPTDDREVPFVFHARSSDYQDVSVQGVINLRITDPQALARRIDFSIDSNAGTYLEQPLERLATLVTELAQQFTWHYLTHHALTEILESGFDEIRSRIFEGLGNDQGIHELGLLIASVRIVAVRPEQEVEKALRTPARESIQQKADEATFKRRALAVEKERAIGENELQSQIELAKREQALIQQRGGNEHRRVTDEAQARQIEASAKAERTDILSQAEANRIRVTEGARVESESARMAIYRDFPSEAMAGLALQNLSNNLPTIEHLTVSPDMLGELVNRFVAHKFGTRS